MKSYTLYLAIICLIMSGCSYDQIGPTSGENIGPLDTSNNIFVVGDINGASSLWTRNSRDTLSNNSSAQSVFVYGNDIYVAGWIWKGINRQATYWKNDNRVSLSGASANAYAVSVFVSGGDVHVAGWYSSGDTALAKYWKNGVETTLSSSGLRNSVATSVFVSGEDVYVSGYVWNNVPIAAYWKNGQAVLFTDGSYPAYAQSIFVSGSDVYAAGFIHSPNTTASYWKNGRLVSLSNNASAQSIVVSGNDVYVAGSKENPGIKVPTSLGVAAGDNAVYWKNGNIVYLTDRADDGVASSICVSPTGAVYVAGYRHGQAAYWNNGNLVSLDSDGWAHSIFITEK